MTWQEKRKIVVGLKVETLDAKYFKYIPTNLLVCWDKFISQ